MNRTKIMMICNRLLQIIDNQFAYENKLSKKSYY